jgi:hypothetical protein
MENEDVLKQQLDAAMQTLSPAERELWDSVQKFIQSQTAAGVPRDRAYNMARNLLRTAHNIRALRRRAAFKVV